MALQKITFVLEEFAVGAPSQQLLDRFLIGHARDGEFRRRENLQVAAWLAPAAENSTAFADATAGLAARERDFHLVQFPALAGALKDASAVLIAGSAERLSPNEELLRSVLEQAPRGMACFVHGCLSPTHAGATRLASLAAGRNLPLASGTSLATTFRLPDVDVREDTLLTEALIVVQGPLPLAELWAMDGLLPIVARRRGNEAGLRSVRGLEGAQVWRAAEQGQWSRALMAAAISRSNTTQGDAVKDGRTQDLIGLGLVKKLTKEPRAWLIEHRDGLRSTILVLDGVIADFNFAVRSQDGTITSAQLYRPPPPNRAEFDRLTAVLEDFFETGIAPWPIQRSLLISEFMEKVTT